MNFRHLPKIELHLHLDCSLSYKVVQQIDPSVSLETYQQNFIAPAKCNDLADFITRADCAIALMQSREQLRLVTLDLFEQLQEDGVIYAEIRFAPLLHTQQGLKGREVVQTVLDAMEEGIGKTGVQAGLILCTLRHYSEEESLETVKLVKDFESTRVVGFDIAADEAGFPINAHIAAFQFAQKHRIACTAHAGEARGPASVYETLEHFKPLRIGHGVRSIEDEKLIQRLIAEQIHLEVCPTSNVQVNVVDTINDHPVDRLYEAGVSFSINTDCRTITNVSLEDEYQTMSSVFSWTKAHLMHCNLEAAKHTFTSEKEKEELRKKILDGWQD